MTEVGVSIGTCLASILLQEILAPLCRLLWPSISSPSHNITLHVKARLAEGGPSYFRTLKVKQWGDEGMPGRRTGNGREWNGRDNDDEDRESSGGEV